MLRLTSSVTAVLSAAIFLSTAVAGEVIRPSEVVPPLKDLRKPVVAPPPKEDDKTIVPSAVSAAKRVADVALLAPPDPVWYITAPDVSKLNASWNASPPGALTEEPTVVKTFRNNRFGLKYLFGDLPDAVITPERVSAMASSLELADVLAKMSEKMAAACYISPDGEFNFLFLFDIGLNREPAFETITNWETNFFLANPGSTVGRGDHSGNFLDVWRLKERGDSKQTSEVSAGFAENIAIVSNSAALAAASMKLLDGGDNLSASKWGRRLAASAAASSTADILAFVRIDTLLNSLSSEPIARASVSAWADYLGYGGKDGEATYYGLQFVPEGTRETFLIPPSGSETSSSLVELLAKRLKPIQKWTAPAVIPYQPSPALYFAAMLEGWQLGGFLRQDRRLFGLSAGPMDFEVPAEVKKVITNELVSMMTGEIGLAFFPATDQPASWLMVIPCSNNPTAVLTKTETMMERNGTIIRSNLADWRRAPCWTVVGPTVFRRLNGNFFIVASDGDIMVSTLDQLLAGSSFAINKDFIRAISQAEANQGMLMYMSVPEILVRQYPNLSHIMRSVYPRSSGLNSRPPLAVLRRYAKGVLASIAPSENGDFTRVTVQAPLPTLGTLAAATVLRFPMSLRAEGRAAMQKSRDNMQTLWLKLQLYSSRFGHFPDNLEDLIADMRQTMSEEEIQAITTAPAALSRMDAKEAAVKSYRYLSGVTPNDEPDVPILYEAQAWTEDFSGMYPTDKSRAPNETGEFQPYRQYICLDGTVVTMPEKRFQARVVARLAERE